MIAAVDPGVTNLGLWKGHVVGLDDIVTTHLAKIDLRANGKKPLYEAVINELQDQLADCSHVVIETQQPRNVPARIIATSLYGFCRGRGIPVSFSGAKMKAVAIQHLSKKFGVEGRLQKQGGHAANKKNAVMLLEQLILQDPVLALCAVGRKKDDMADAILLGLGFYINKN